MIGQKVSDLEDSARQDLNNKSREVNQLAGENSKLGNTIGKKENTEKGAQDTRTEVKRVLDKYLMDDRIIHSNDKFTKVEGIQNSSIKTVTYSNKIYDTRFIEKKDDKRDKEDSFRSTIVEVIAGTLCKALLYDRSPTFTLMEDVSEKSSPCEIKLKSKLLNNFVTLNQFMLDEAEEMVAELMREKFANENGIEELASYLKPCFLVETLMMNNYGKESKELEEFFDGIIKQYKVMRSDFAKKKNVSISYKEKVLIHKKTLSQIFKKFEGDSEGLNTLFFQMILASSSFDGGEVSEDKDILKQLLGRANKKLNQEVGGAEKLIAAMLLLGYRDFHGGNFGIIRTEQEDVKGNKIIESVYAKVDMSASFYNLSHDPKIKGNKIVDTSALLDNLLYGLNSRCYKSDLQKMLSIKLSGVEFVRGYYVKHDIDYIKLKEEINKACDLFIENPAYITSLVHRALLYKKPLLKTGEVESFVNQLKIQAKLLKEFANSTEFENLKELTPEECYIGCQNYDQYRSEPIIVKLTRAVKANLVGKAVSTQETLNIQDLESNSDQQGTQPKVLTANCNPSNMVTESDNTKIPVSGQVNNIQGNNIQKSHPKDAASQNEKRSKLPAAVASILVIAGVISILAMEIAIGACCLVAAAIIHYCNKPSKSLENSNAQRVTPKELCRAQVKEKWQHG